MSTKFPLTLLLMELTEGLRFRDLKLYLEWIRREDNIEADALSNEDWGDFNEELREIRRPERIGWKVLDELKVRGEEVKAFALASTAITPHSLTATIVASSSKAAIILFGLPPLFLSHAGNHLINLETKPRAFFHVL